LEEEVGRTLNTNKRGLEKRDFYEIIDPPESCFNPQEDLNDTNMRGVVICSPLAETFDGTANLTPPFDPPSPLTLVLGMTEAERRRPVRNDDPEGYGFGPRRDGRNDY
jgi:hypothetical protein